MARRSHRPPGWFGCAGTLQPTAGGCLPAQRRKNSSGGPPVGALLMKLATLCYVRDGVGKKGRTLMLHRIKKANDMHAGKWNGLGGKVEGGESPEECALREVWEESGLRMINPVLRGVITFPQFSSGE